MVSERAAKDAYELCRTFAARVKEGTDMWYQLVGMAGILGWVIEEPYHHQNTQELLREMRSICKMPEFPKDI
jgi:hypothetical protein